MKELTPGDINVLMQALEVWQQVPYMQKMQDELTAGVVKSIAPAGAAEVDFEMRKRHAANDRETDSRRDRSILLQAKLIGMRDELVAAELTRRRD